MGDALKIRWEIWRRRDTHDIAWGVAEQDGLWYWSMKARVQPGFEPDFSGPAYTDEGLIKLYGGDLDAGGVCETKRSALALVLFWIKGVE